VFSIVYTVHSLLRWLVLVGVAVRAGVGWYGLVTGREPGGPDRRASLVSVILTDVQLTVGLLLWGFLSPTVSAARSDMGAAMKNGGLRWVLVEHPTLMVFAVVLIHVGQVLTKRATTSRQHALPALLATVALAAMLVGMVRHG
jgi:hypothetical protein